MGWSLWGAIENAASSVASGVENAASTVGHDVTSFLQDPSSPLVRAENWVNNSPVAPIINAIHPSIGVSTGFGSGTPSGTTVHPGLTPPAPPPVSNQTINNTVNNAVGNYHQNNPSVTQPTNPIQTIPNPQAYNPGYKPVGQVNSSNYNGAQPVQHAAPVTSGSSTAANIPGPLTNNLTSNTNPANNTGTKSSDANWQQWVTPGAIVASGAIQAGTSLAAGAQTAQAAKDAAAAQTDATNKAVGLAQSQNTQQQQNAQPWLNAGKTALGDANTPGTLIYRALHPNQFNYQESPGYQWSLNQGLEALQHAAAARGMDLSGNTMKALTSYAENAANADYGDQFNRWMAQQGQQLDSLQSLAGLGQTAVQQVGQSGQNYVNNATNALISGGQAQAQGIVGAANANASAYMGASNAASNTAGNYANNLMGTSLLAALLRPVGS